ncbi:MAG: excinuclease ABC subunit C [Rhodothermales bacterium]|nr:excinuclease ABC subunit C [Rhodothermales bacterium]
MPIDLNTKVSALPRQPGVYIHRDVNGKPLYIGKAKNLRSRVRSYFQESRPLDGRLGVMVRKVADVDVIVTHTEAEALILENNLIKELRPRYNINLRDDKSYPYVCIKNERFPRVFPTRKIVNDGSKYFGPYTSVKNLRIVLDTIRSLFKLRTCSLNLRQDSIEEGKFSTCLEYHIDNCAGPCVGYQSEESYMNVIAQVEQLLNGKTKALRSLLEEEMHDQADSMNFEAAADLRDRINALEKYSRRQRIVSNDFEDRDVFAISVNAENKIGCGTVFQVREGVVVGRQRKYLRGLQDRPLPMIMQAWVERYYSEATFFPDEILLADPLEDEEPLLDFLRQKKGRTPAIKIPVRGDKAALVRMVSMNARVQLDEYLLEIEKEKEARIPYALKSLQADLRLRSLPKRMECFDISHLAGTGTVASCVVFENGLPKKSEYRTYNIRTVEDGKPDDFQSMKEAVTRRYRRVLENNGPWPELVVIDGGKGQLSSAVEALKEVGAYGQFQVIGLAKRLEEVFFPFDSDSVIIPKTSAALQILQRIRNEAHRFAVTSQRKQRKKKTLTSELTSIDGVGEKTARKLMKHFGSVRRIKNADLAALADAVGDRLGTRVYSYFNEAAD